MTVGLNTANKLIRNRVVFNSANIPELKMINTRYYDKNSSLLNPNIETFQILDNKNITAEFSSRRFKDGSRFEIYRLPDEIVKIFKNRFGEIKAFKSSIEQHNKQPEMIYENIKNTMRSKTHNFLA